MKCSVFMTSVDRRPNCRNKTSVVVWMGPFTSCSEIPARAHEYKYLQWELMNTNTYSERSWIQILTARSHEYKYLQREVMNTNTYCERSWIQILTARSHEYKYLLREVMNTFGGRAFFYAAPKLWNNLPSSISSFDSFSSF